MLRIFAWNPNGIRALIKHNAASSHLENFIREQRPDVVFFPETKGNPETQYETQRALELIFQKAAPQRKWTWYWTYCDRPGRHGNAVAIDAALAVEQVNFSLVPNGRAESEGRVIALKLKNASMVPGRGLWIVGLYVPNASTKLVRLEFKQNWLRQLRQLLDNYQPDTVIALGDINVAPDMRDLCHPDANLQTPGYSPQERETFSWMLQAAMPPATPASLTEDSRKGQGYIDVWRHRHPLPYKTQGHQGIYSFWNTRSKARERNAGWRIDMVLIDRESYTMAEDNITDVMICPQYHGSDHCPVGIEIKLEGRNVT